MASVRNKNGCDERQMRFYHDLVRPSDMLISRVAVQGTEYIFPSDEISIRSSFRRTWEMPLTVMELSLR